MAEDSGSGGGHEKYLETLNFVVNFLHEEGFLKAHGVLLAEFSTRLSSPAAEGVVFAAARQTASACSAPPSPLEYSERALEALSPPRSKSAQAGSNWPSRLSSQRQRPLWDGEVDDYESMDDPGYNRRDVPSQTRFAEAELDACSEDGSERAYFMHQPGDLNYDDVESEVSASDLEGATAASSVQSGRRGHSGGSGGGPLHSHSQSHSQSGAGDAHDETWDLGPTDIKFAEPVSTPSKSPEKQDPDARRPVLSRVESLSSSFKDFEMERGLYTDGEGEGQLSSKVSDAEYVSDAEAIDFPVPVVSHEDVELFQQKQRRPSPTSSMDVAAGSLAPSVAPSRTSSEQQLPLRPFEGLGMGLAGGKEPRAGGGRRKASAKGASLLKALGTGWVEGDFASASAFERKSATDGGEASPAPRSPDAAASTSASAAAAAITEEDVALEWEFKPPVVDRLLTDSREPSLEFSTPNSDDEGAGTPTAAPTPSSGGSGPVLPPGEGGDAAAGAAAVAGDGDGLSDEATAASVGEVEGDAEEGGTPLDVQVESVTLAGELEAREAAAAFVLQPPRPAAGQLGAEEGEEEGAVSLSGPLAVGQLLAMGPLLAVGPPAASPSEALERKDSSHVVAHQINFELEDLAAEQSGGGDATAAAALPSLDVAGQPASPRSPVDASGAAGPHPARPHHQHAHHAHHAHPHNRHHRAGRDQEGQGQGQPGEEELSSAEALRQHLLQQQQQQQQYEGTEGGEEAGDEGGDDGGAFGEGSLYDGEEADVDEPQPEDGDGLEEQLSSLVDDRLDDDDDGEEEEEEEGGGRRRGRGLEGEVEAWGEEERLRAEDAKGANNNPKATTQRARPDNYTTHKQENSNSTASGPSP
ncbi:hypothetical protein TSOC_006510 [Tetrabaena socialis]|uniref:LisH domain-containing protein n=1 Tax=Tetrabaena socialis TaxID=47790 RepID=A0A2J8A3G8_9CHLO|nr:hypothetical protein TSOC_006510 [Tetrabaena socialis]|eukprot:PNH07069.1 hypothetical protein TSOC_006510 [Tetrabaena socialis]